MLFKLPYMGIPTFLRSEVATDRSDINSGIAFVGIPYDTGASNKPGARYAPRAFREVSLLYAYQESSDYGVSFFDPEDKSASNNKLDLIDTNDIFTIPENRKKSEKIITSEISKLIKNKTFPFIVGGDHSISFPIVRAFDSEITILHFDAHLDFMGDKYIDSCAHGTCMQRACNLPNVKNIIHCGIRGLLNSPQGYMHTEMEGNTIITASEILKSGLPALKRHLKETEKYYISFDADFLDSTIMYATGTPETGGIGYRLASEILRWLGKNMNIVGIDFVEFNPLFDIQNNNAQTLVRLSLDFLINWSKFEKK